MIFCYYDKSVLCPRPKCEFPCYSLKELGESAMRARAEREVEDLRIPDVGYKQKNK